MTQPNIPTPGAEDPKPGTPGYDAAMAAKFREAGGAIEGDLLKQYVGGGANEEGGNQPAQRPDNVPEKFWDAETGQVRVDELLKSYAELERGVGKKKEAQAPQSDQAAADAAKEAVERAGLDWNELGQKVATRGKLDDSDYEALTEIGIPKELVDRHIQLLQLEADQAVQTAVAYVGGEKAVEELFGWARENLTPEQIAGYDRMLAGSEWKVAIDTLKMLKDRSSPTSGEPKLINPTGGSQGSVVGYKSQDEMLADQRNPLYRENSPRGEAFRREVMEKARVSKWRRAAA